MYADAYASTIEKVPDEPHWAIIKTNSTHVPGDARSVSNPGHGYPAHTVNSINYEVYLTQEGWQDAIQRLEDSSYPENYKALYVRTATVSSTVNVSIT